MYGIRSVQPSMLGKILALCLFVAVSAFSHSSASGYTEVQDEASVPILTPSFAQRNTRKLILDNGLQVYLVLEWLTLSSTFCS